MIWFRIEKTWVTMTLLMEAASGVVTDTFHCIQLIHFFKIWSVLTCPVSVSGVCVCVSLEVTVLGLFFMVLCCAAYVSINVMLYTFLFGWSAQMGLKHFVKMWMWTIQMLGCWYLLGTYLTGFFIFYFIFTVYLQLVFLTFFL